MEQIKLAASAPAADGVSAAVLLSNVVPLNLGCNCTHPTTRDPQESDSDEGAGEGIGDFLDDMP
jgi:hypothetical protein